MRWACASLIGALWIDLPVDGVMIQIASGVNKFSLLAIPFFVLAGAIMAEGGMARRLVAFAGVLVGFMRGGLSLVNILASTFFGAISGSSVADTASIGSVLIPEMEKKGYPRDFSTAVTVQRLDPGHADPAQPQRGDLLARSRRLGVGGRPVPGRRVARPAAGLHHCRAVPGHRAQAQLPGRRAHPADARRCASASTRCGA